MSVERIKSFETVMVIDDNLIDLYIASRIIINNNFGKKVIQYSSGLEALKFLQENQDVVDELPQVIFLDIYMPFMNGFEFMTEYDKLSLRLKQNCKVLIISSSKNEKDVVKAANDRNIISMEEKPITGALLQSTIKKLWEVD